MDNEIPKPLDFPAAAFQPLFPLNPGKLALVTAVGEGNPQIAELLLSFGANASASEPETGCSAVVLAFATEGQEVRR